MFFERGQKREGELSIEINEKEKRKKEIVGRILIRKVYR